MPGPATLFWRDWPALLPAASILGQTSVMRKTYLLTLVTSVLLSGCAAQSQTSQSVQESADEWRVHCETDLSYTLDIRAVPGVYHGRWLWAEDDEENVVTLKGRLDGGFFLLESVTSPSSGNLPPDEGTLTGLCRDTIARDEPRDLARVLAARDSSDLDIPIIYPGTAQPARKSRLVVFSDSLSDAGRLKHRMQVFPGKPYWLGRFSNGPVWVDYLDHMTDLAILNRSYGGASINKPHEIDEAGLIGFIKDEGRFFVSGSLGEQITDYLALQSTPNNINSAEETVFLVWAGANDYISKEPITGLITTFLNNPKTELGYQTVVDDTVAGIIVELRRLYQAGARSFLVVDLPDMGKTPIIMQNETYTSGSGRRSDSGRRYELSQRLSVLSDYHNSTLANALADLADELTSADIRSINAHGFTKSVLSGRSSTDPSQAFDYGFELETLSETLEYDSHSVVLQKPCYTGAYLGSLNEDDTCPVSHAAFFWDVIHPATLAHCWQSYLVGDALANAGWVDSMEQPAFYRDWCKAKVDTLLK